MTVRYLTEEEVERLLPMTDALGAVEEAFGALGKGEAVNRPRQRVQTGSSTISVMLAGWGARGYFGFKYYAASREGTHFWFHLFDAKSGELVAIMQADRLGQRRTGAASGVATTYLARSDASTVGIIGTGWQAESQLEAVCAVRPIRHIRCFGRNTSGREAFAKTMSARLRIDVRAAGSPEAAVADADIVVAATTARDPVVLGKWLAPGSHVNAIGANRLEARELDDEVIRRAALITVDSIDQAKQESGDLVEPVERGRLSWDHVHELGHVVAGTIRGRTRDDEITVFKSLGVAIEDVAVGAHVYERARDHRVGRDVSL